MAGEQNKETIRQYLQDSWGKGDISVADRLLVPDYKLIALSGGSPSMGSGGSHAGAYGGGSDKDGVIRDIGMYREAFPDLRFDIDLLLAEDDKVAAQWTATGTNTGSMRGMPATNKAVTYSGVTIYTLRGDQITEERYFGDRLGLWQQLGVVHGTRELFSEATHQT